MQKTQWRSRTSNCQFRWFDCSRSQGPQWQLRISKQSSIRSRGAGSSHSMDPGVSVQKQNFPGTREETKSHLHWQFLGIWQGVKIFPGIIARLHHTDRRLLVCGKSSAQSKGRHLCCIAAIGSKWKLVGRFHGMLHLFAKRHRCIVWWEDAFERLFGQPFTGPIIPWFIGWVSSYNCERSVAHPSIWKESFTWIVPRIRSLRGGNLEGWRTDRRPWGVGNDGRIRNLLEKTQSERGDISQRRRIYVPNRRWTNQNTWRRSGTENIHLGTASTNSRRRSRWLSWRIRRVSSTTSRLTSGRRWSYERFLVHVGKLHTPPSRWTQSQT